MQRSGGQRPWSSRARRPPQTGRGRRAPAPPRPGIALRPLRPVGPWVAALCSPASSGSRQQPLRRAAAGMLSEALEKESHLSGDLISSPPRPAVRGGCTRSGNPRSPRSASYRSRCTTTRGRSCCVVSSSTKQASPRSGELCGTSSGSARHPKPRLRLTPETLRLSSPRLVCTKSVLSTSKSSPKTLLRRSGNHPWSSMALESMRQMRMRFSVRAAGGRCSRRIRS
mmetsp:Transcript_34811/g.98692  ORF Transcript_34811/g.98692 Transcript_34811/m.98692 type:complete len:226 (+) Transcript_34811:1056-1733(+)